MLDMRLYLAQRLSALIMVPLALGHIAVMIIAVQGGLTTDEILGRTQGSLWWMLFYGTFSIAVSVHAAIGVRVVVHEWFGVRGLALSALTWVIWLVLLITGLKAVAAVTL